ncbi:hypothetical protein Q6272_29460, partial [Klebsiella pneumoniae]|uniref:hypothetical protein n=1 Tax=Klebsiella pneumoniae TaxID=573 RepID=UPI00272EFCB7
SKAELISRLEELIAQEDVEQASDAVDGVKETYEALVAAAAHSAQHEGQAEEQVEGAPVPQAGEEAPNIAIKSATLLDPEDKRFKQLLDSF